MSVPRRYLVVPVLWALVAFLGGVSLSVGSAALLSFVATMVWTVVDLGLLRGKLFGKVGKTVVAWWLVHLAAETLSFAVVVSGACLAFGVHGGNHTWIAVVAAIATWGGLCLDTAKTVALVVCTAALVPSPDEK